MQENTTEKEMTLEEIKSLLPDYLKTTNYAPRRLKEHFICRNPHHPDNNGSMIYHSQKDNRTGKTSYYCKCFGKCGACYNVFDLVILDYNIGLNKPIGEETEEELNERLKDPKNLYPAIATLGEVLNIPLNVKAGEITEEQREQIKEAKRQADQRKKEQEAQEQEHRQKIEAAITSFINGMEAPTGEALEYLHKRAFTDETIKLFNFKIFPRQAGGVQSVYLPYTPKAQTEKDLNILHQRNFKVTAQNEKPGTPRFNIFKRDSYLNIFDPFNILDSQKPRIIFLTEGEYDTISLYQTIINLNHEGKKFPLMAGAVATGGASKTEDLLNVLKGIDKTKIYICLVPDNDLTGAKTWQDLGLKLEENEIKHAFLNLPNESGKIKDVNDLLKENPEELKSLVYNIINNIENLASEEAKAREQAREEQRKQEREKFKKTRSNLAYISALDHKIYSPKEIIKTGFEILDDEKHLNGLHEGVITLGAITSIGKTSFLIQVADQIAQKYHRPILYISLETTKAELMARSISRNMYLLEPYQGQESNLMSYSDILSGNFYFKNDFTATGERKTNEKKINLFEAAREKYLSYAGYLYFVDYEEIQADPITKITGFRVEDLSKYANEIKDTLGQAPIIFIDYLQLMGAPGGSGTLTDKQIIDRNMIDLKVLSHELETSIILVSSLNRNGYNNLVTLESFKESGAIEYTSDVIIGLNYYLTSEQEADLKKKIESKKGLPDGEKQKAITEFYKELGRKQPRKIKVDILKNRFGFSFSSINFSCLTSSMYFFEDESRRETGYYRNLLNGKEYEETAEEIAQGLPFN